LTARYQLQQSAEDDLRGILRYTREKWGKDQAQVYAAKLETGIQRLVEGKGVYKILAGIHPSLRVARCESHYIFCLWRGDEPSLIVAILHERMDLIVRISERLE
jgi:plasmid stabilization system protein ParE